RSRAISASAAASASSGIATSRPVARSRSRRAMPSCSHSYPPNTALGAAPSRRAGTDRSAAPPGRLLCQYSAERLLRASSSRRIAQEASDAAHRQDEPIVLLRETAEPIVFVEDSRGIVYGIHHDADRADLFR